MRSHLVFISLVSILMAGCGALKKGPDLPRVNKNMDVTYEVMILPRGHGSGIVVHEDGYMITNYHVCGNGERELRVTVSREGAASVRLKAVVLGYDEEQDICVIKVDHRFENPVVLEDIRNVHAGDAVYNIGYPYSFGKLVNRGSVAAKAWSNSALGVRNGIVVDMEFAHPGSSGSGVYLVKSGNLIGLIKLLAWRQSIRGLTRLPRMTVKICVGVDDIKRLLDKYNIPYHTDRDSNTDWSVPVSGDSGAYQIEIIQVKPTSEFRVK